VNIGTQKYHIFEPGSADIYGPGFTGDELGTADSWITQRYRLLSDEDRYALLTRFREGRIFKDAHDAVPINRVCAWTFELSFCGLY
jgi:hypothetical protein